MTVFPTCNGCARDKSDCPTLAALKAAIAGKSVTTVRHRCRQREPRFRPGDPIWVDTFSGDGGLDEDIGRVEPVRREWPGYFISEKKSKGHVYIKPGAPALDDEEYTFEARNKGFCNIVLARLRPREGEWVDPFYCGRCMVHPKLEGFCNASTPERKKCKHHKPVMFLGGVIELTHCGEWIDPNKEEDPDDIPF